MSTSESISEFLRLYGRLFEKSADGVVIGTPDGLILRANAAAHRILGYTEAELIALGRDGTIVPDEDLRDFVTARDRDGFARGSLTMRRADGTRLPVEVTSWMLPVPGGGDFSYVVFRDVSALREAEQAGQDRRAELEALLRASLDGYWLVAPEGQVLDVNEAAADMLGYTRAEMLALRVPALEANEDVEAVRAHMAMMRARGWDRFFTRHRRKDGTVIDVEVSVYFVPTAGGRFVCFVRDVTAANAAERTIRESEARFRALAQSAPVGIFETRPAGGNTYVNPSALGIMGIPAEAASGLGWLDAVHPEDRAAVLDAWARMSATGTPFSGECRYQRPDGRAAHVLVNIAPVRNGGQVTGFVGCMLDVTHAREIEAALRSSEALLRAIADSTPDPIYAKDLLGRWTFANAASLGVVGKPREEVLGQTDAEILGDLQVARRLAENDRMVRDGGLPVTFDEKVGGPGGVRDYLTTKSPLRDGDGKTVGIVGVSKDMTEQRRVEKQLAVASRLASLGTLVAGVAHEVNNPLTTVMAGLGSAMEDVARALERLQRGEVPGREELIATGREELELLQDASEGAARIARIVKDLSIFGSANEGREWARIADVVQGAMRWLPPSVPEMALVTMESLEAPELHVARGQIEQVVVNLVTNAARATTPGTRGEIRIRTGPGSEGHVRLEVSDRGVGMDADILSRIFTPFFTTRPSGEMRGTGLGLAICHAIVTAHGGTVCVASEPGRGSTFTVELPAASGRGAAPAAGG